ncbi:MAG: methionine--tRNA ligase [Firmicutes bacterium]|nr:methionine--tRNA ligase [Bacillota bacterium]
MKRKILIGLSWPYANGRLHIGHVASSLPADVLARYHRLVGNDVSFITGSDCYGTPILVAAKNEGITPLQLSDKYHAHHTADFKSIGFTFDNYTKTTSPYHNKFVADFHAQMYRDNPLIYAKSAMQLYCEDCNKYLPDRYVEGVCPHCKENAKGDSCDGCGKILEPEDLLEPKCKLCSGSPVPRNTRQLYLKLSALEKQIRDHYDFRKDTWANNAVGLTGRYLNEGLIDRAITRNIEWGVPLPADAKEIFNLDANEFNEKKIYIWAENVLGYLSATAEFCEKTGRDWREFLLSSSGKHNCEGCPGAKKASCKSMPPLHYYVHAKDNIPFHSIILPGLLLANSRGEQSYHLPDIIVSSEYVKIVGDKMSKSKGNLITIEELVSQYDTDMIRYYFLRNVNDKKDVNFTQDDFIAVINAELVNGFGNLVNRTLSFIKTKMDGTLKSSKPDKAVITEIEKTFTDVGELIHAGKINRALVRGYELVTTGNKLFDEYAPWKSIKENPEKCNQDIFTIVTIIANLANILSPFIPNATKKIAEWLSVPQDDFNIHIPTKTITINEIEVLFKRL